MHGGAFLGARDGATAAAVAQVSTGVTLRENNLKEIQGGMIMSSQGVLVGNRTALHDSPELLAIVHELIERFEAHLSAGAVPPTPPRVSDPNHMPYVLAWPPSDYCVVSTQKNDFVPPKGSTWKASPHLLSCVHWDQTLTEGAS